MAVARVQTPEGIMLLDVPEGTTPEQIEAFAAEQLRNKAEALEDGPVDYEIGRSIENLPGSTLNVGKDMAQGVSQLIVSPIDTIAGLGKLAGGEVAKGGRNVANMFLEDDIEPFDFESLATEFNEDLVDRYGSVDAIKRTAMEDPAGILIDLLSTVAPAARIGKVPVLEKMGALEPMGAIKRGVQNIPNVGKKAVRS